MFYNLSMSYTSELSYSYTLGMSISIELLQKHPHLVREVIYSSKIKLNDYFQKLEELCFKYDVTLREDDRLIHKLSVKENCYVIAFFDKFYLPFTSRKILAIKGLKDEGMLGTIFRTAVSFGFYDIAMIDSDLDYFKPKVVRSSMGALFYCHIKKYTDLKSFIDDNPALPLIYIQDEGEKEVSELKGGLEYALVFGEEIRKESSYYIKANHIKLPLSVQIAITLQSLYR